MHYSQSQQNKTGALWNNTGIHRTKLCCHLNSYETPWVDDFTQVQVNAQWCSPVCLLKLYQQTAGGISKSMRNISGRVQKRHCYFQKLLHSLWKIMGKLLHSTSDHGFHSLWIQPYSCRVHKCLRVVSSQLMGCWWWLMHIYLMETVQFVTWLCWMSKCVFQVL